MPDPWPIIGWAVIILAMLLGIWAVINDIRERVDQWRSRRRMERYYREQEAARVVRREKHIADFTAAMDRPPESEAELNMWVSTEAIKDMSAKVARFWKGPFGG